MAEAGASALLADKVCWGCVACLVEQAEDMVVVHDVGDELYCGPGRGLVVALAQLLERHLVHRLDLWDIALPAKAQVGRGALKGGYTEGVLAADLLVGCGQHRGHCH